MQGENGSEITLLLRRWSSGEQDALHDLLPLVHYELKRLASAYLRREKAGHTLETGALVNEAFLRLVRQRAVDWQSRAHFFGIAATVMRRILVDHARRSACASHGGGAAKVPLSAALHGVPAEAPEILAVDEALSDLEACRPEQARVVELRFFAGLSNDEIAQVLGVSLPTVSRRWAAARAWLYRRIHAAGS